MSEKPDPRPLPAPDPERLRQATALSERAPIPARAGSVLLGTAGWTDRTLVSSGLFYPRGVTKAEARLRHYAAHFPMVEVDATYYTLLPASVAENWVAWTPADFVFDIKAHPVFTGHPIDVTRLPSDLKQALTALGHEKRVYAERLPSELLAEIEARFVALTVPLREANKLGCVMLQFPPWFQATRGNARRIETLAVKLEGIPLAVEFRHRSWLAPERRARVFALLREHGMAYVAVDEPDVEIGGVPPIVEATSDALGIVRFHGHNVAGWQKRGASVHERFDWLYTPAELAAWVEPVRRLTQRAERVHAVFNNCVQNYAVLGAQGLSVLLTDAEKPLDSAD